MGNPNSIRQVRSRPVLDAFLAWLKKTEKAGTAQKFLWAGGLLLPGPVG